TCADSFKSRYGNFLLCDVSLKSDQAQTKFLGSLTSGVFNHSDIYYITLNDCQYLLTFEINDRLLCCPSRALSIFITHSHPLQGGLSSLRPPRRASVSLISYVRYTGQCSAVYDACSAGLNIRAFALKLFLNS